MQDSLQSFQASLPESHGICQVQAVLGAVGDGVIFIDGRRRNASGRHFVQHGLLQLVALKGHVQPKRMTAFPASFYEERHGAARIPEPVIAFFAYGSVFPMPFQSDGNGEKVADDGETMGELSNWEYADARLVQMDAVAVPDLVGSIAHTLVQESVIRFIGGGADLFCIN